MTTKIQLGGRTLTRQFSEELMVYIDEPDTEARGTILIAPPFGITARNLFLPAFILASNGYRVVRFDPRDHVGESPGTMWTFTLSQFAEDIQRMLGWYTPDIVLGFSLAAPSVLRALAESGSAASPVLAAPVVNLQYTLNAVLEKDYFTPENFDMPQEIVVLGEHIDGRQFRDDSIEHDLDTLADAVAGASQVKGTLSLVAGTEDPWVSIDEVREVVASREEQHGAERTRLRLVSVGTHQFNLNPAVANAYMAAVLAECLQLSGADESAGRVPPLHKAIEDRQEIEERFAAAEADGGEAQR